MERAKVSDRRDPKPKMLDTGSRKSNTLLGHIWYHKSCTLAGWLVLRRVGGVASSVMSPRPRIGLIHQPSSHSYCFYCWTPAPGVELCWASQLRDDERADSENSPPWIYWTNQWPMQQIFQGSGQQITIIVRQFFFVQTAIFSTRQQQVKMQAQCFVVFGRPLFMWSFSGAMSRNVCLKSGCHDPARARAQTITLVLRDPPTGLRSWQSRAKKVRDLQTWKRLLT